MNQRSETQTRGLVSSAGYRDFLPLINALLVIVSFNVYLYLGQNQRPPLRLLRPELSVFVTASWSAPWRFVKRFDPILNSATFAGRQLRFEPDLARLYRPFAFAWCSVAAVIVLQVLLSRAIQLEDRLLLDVALTALAISAIVVAVAYYNTPLFAHMSLSRRSGAGRS